MAESQRTGGSSSPDSAVARPARWLLYATLLVPLVVFPGFLFPFVTLRAVYFRVVVELAAAMLLYVVLRRELIISFRRDFVFWALLAWIAANTVAAVIGVAPMRSFFGDHERMGGVWFWIHLLAYYVLLRTFLRDEDWWRFMRIAVGVAAVIAGYGLLQEWFRPFDFIIGGITAGVTIGNNGLLAPYLLANVAFCGLLAIRGGAHARPGYAILAMLLVVALAFSGNRSSVLALLVGSGAGFAFYAFRTGALRSWRVIPVIGLFAITAILPFVTRAPWARPVTNRIPVLRKLATGMDSSRVIQWRAALDGIRERPLLGVGPENYQVIWSQYHHPEMHRFVSDSRWDRAHNAYLDAFATAGIFGFLSLLAIWLALTSSAWEAARQGPTESTWRSGAAQAGALEGIAFGFFVAYAFYLVFWFFDLNSTMLWIALAAFVGSRAAKAPLIAIGAPRGKRWQTTMVLGIGAAALVSVVYVHGFETLRMARTLDHARNPKRPLQEVLSDYESVFGSPAPVTQHAFLMYAGRLRDLYPEFKEIRSDPAQAELFDRAFMLAIGEFERQARQDPLNERVLVQHARVLMLGAYYYGNARLYESALEKLQHAVTLSPRRVNTHLVLGVAYLNAGRPDLALKVFLDAYAVYPPLGQTHSYLAQAYSKLGQYDSAGVWLRSAMLHGHSPDRDLLRTIAGQLAAAGRPRAGAEVILDYLARRSGPAFLWTAGMASRDVANAELALLAGDLFSLAGDSAKAHVVRAAAPALCARPAPLPSLASHPGRFDQAPACPEPWRVPDVY